MKNNNHIKNEIVIAIVSPLGTDKKIFIENLEEKFREHSYHPIRITVTDLVFDVKKMEALDCNKKLKLFLKMQYCSNLRKAYCRSIMACLAIQEIQKIRNKKENSKLKRIVYIIDQLKNPSECKLLNHVYGISFIQISLFSNYSHRDSFLKKTFENDDEEYSINIKSNFYKSYLLNNIYYKKARLSSKKNDLLSSYKKDILKDGSHRLIEKDMKETDQVNYTEDSGQCVSDTFHLSHYFFNLDKNQSDIKKEINKFFLLLFGEYEDYPTQGEFGMALAYHGSYRSTFPHQRHVGACIISQEGEVISVASIRSPTPSANTKTEHIDNIKDGYNKYKEKIDEYYKILNSIKKSNREKIDEIIKFIKDSLDFHPTTHAEMAALSDATKLGISVRGSTLYVTTFPCHICAKDIITFGISKVVYLEQYPKSKNAELYPNLISFDDEDTKDKIPFIIYSGISPRRYHYVYDLKNKPDNTTNNKKSNNNSTSESKLSPKLLEYEKPSYNKIRESDIIKLFKEIVISINKNDKNKLKALKNNQLYNVLDVSVKEKKDKS